MEGPLAIVALVAALVVVLGFVIRALTHRAYRQGGAEVARQVLETDHEKQKAVLEHLQKSPPRGPALGARWRKRMRPPAAGD